MLTPHRTVIVGTGSIVDVDAPDSDCVVTSTGMARATFDADPATLAPGDPFWANYVKVCPGWAGQIQLRRYM